MHELALYAGAGGGILGGILSGFRTICAVEKDAYCREVLLRRQQDGVLPMFPIWDDIRTFDGRPWRGVVDIVTAGFPCQPFSVAGRQRGELDDQNLWPDTIRVLREVGAPYALLENVANLASKSYFGEILGSLHEAGFNARWGVISAGELGAPHERKRLWIVAHADGTREQQPSGALGEIRGRAQDSRKACRMADAGGEGLEGVGLGAGGSGEALPMPAGGGEAEALADASIQLERELPDEADPQPGGGESRGEPRCGGWWEVEPQMGRMVDVLAHRMDQLRAIGNGQVSIVAQVAWERLKGI